MIVGIYIYIHVLYMQLVCFFSHVIIILCISTISLIFPWLVAVSLGGRIGEERRRSNHSASPCRCYQYSKTCRTRKKGGAWTRSIISINILINVN